MVMIWLSIKLGFRKALEMLVLKLDYKLQASIGVFVHS